MLELPKKKEKELTDASKLVILAFPKTGKTSLIARLDDCLVLDLEGRMKNYGGTYWDLKEIAVEQGISVSDAFFVAMKSLLTKVKENKGPLYKYLAIDTITVLEDVAKDLALKMYKETPMGKAFKGSDVTLLPRGAGYGYLRNAFKKIYQTLEPVYSKCLIMLAHPKDSSIMKNGENLQATDIALTGTLKNILAADVDAIGLLYRQKNTNTNILSFKKTERDLFTGTSVEHLADQEIEMSKWNPETKEIEEDAWDQIFIYN